MNLPKRFPEEGLEEEPRLATDHRFPIKLCDRGSNDSFGRGRQRIQSIEVSCAHAGRFTRCIDRGVVWRVPAAAMRRLEYE